MDEADETPHDEADETPPPEPQEGDEDPETQPADTPEAGPAPPARRTKRRWTEEETEKLKELTFKHGKGCWRRVLEEGGAVFQNRTQARTPPDLI